MFIYFKLKSVFDGTLQQYDMLYVAIYVVDKAKTGKM